MTEPPIDLYSLPPNTTDDLALVAFGKLTPLPLESSASAFTALDSFDQALRRSSRLLLKAGISYELLGHHGQLASQTVKRQPRFITDFPNGPVKRALRGLSPLRSLLTIGSGEIHKQTLAFVDNDGKTHCRAYLLRFTSGEGHTATLSALQGIRGYDESLALLRKHIVNLGGNRCTIDPLYGQLFPDQATYDPKPQISVSATQTAFDAATQIIAGHIPLMRANEFGIIADLDTEFLHDYRVQLRKIRSVLSLFRGVYDEDLTTILKADFSALAAPTGRLRDLDVYLLEKQKFYDLLPDSLHKGLDTLFRLFSEQRAAEKAALAQHLRSPAYEKKINALAKRFTRPRGLKRGEKAGLPAHEYACERIWHRYRKVCKIAAGITPDTKDDEIHQLRIDCKKLRYLMEFFSPIFPAQVLARLLKPLKNLQDNLGLFNDYSVQQESLHDFLLAHGKNRKGADIEVAQSVGALITVLHGLQLQERAKVMKNFARFNRPKVQQTFKALFQERKDAL